MPLVPHLTFFRIAAPAYWLTFEDKTGYLLARVQGLTDSLEISIAFWQEIALEVHVRRPARLLVHESFRNNLSGPDVVEVATFMTELGFTTIKVAFVDDQFEQLDVNRLAETIVADRGMRAKVFADLGEAESWLLGN